MAKRIQKTKQISEKKTEVAEVTKTDDKQELKDELDELLDEIDEVLEENAEEFVASYIQKGGEQLQQLARLVIQPKYEVSFWRNKERVTWRYDFIDNEGRVIWPTLHWWLAGDGFKTREEAEEAAKEEWERYCRWHCEETRKQKFIEENKTVIDYHCDCS